MIITEKNLSEKSFKIREKEEKVEIENEIFDKIIFSILQKKKLNLISEISKRENSKIYVLNLQRSCSEKNGNLLFRINSYLKNNEIKIKNAIDKKALKINPKKYCLKLKSFGTTSESESKKMESIKNLKISENTINEKKEIYKFEKLKEKLLLSKAGEFSRSKQEEWEKMKLLLKYKHDKFQKDFNEINKREKIVFELKLKKQRENYLQKIEETKKKRILEKEKRNQLFQKTQSDFNKVKKSVPLYIKLIEKYKSQLKEKEIVEQKENINLRDTIDSHKKLTEEFRIKLKNKKNKRKIKFKKNRELELKKENIQTSFERKLKIQKNILKKKNIFSQNIKMKNNELLKNNILKVLQTKRFKNNSKDKQKEELMNKIKKNKIREKFFLEEGFRDVKKNAKKKKFYSIQPESKNSPFKNSKKYINYLKQSKRNYFKKNPSLDLKNIQLDNKNKIFDFEKNLEENYSKLKNGLNNNQTQFKKVNDLYINLIGAKLKILQQTVN